MSLDLLISGSRETLWLAPVVGAYLCLSAFGLLRREECNRLIADLRDHPASLHAVGAIAFFVGAALLSFHRHWTTMPEVVVNLVAAWWVFEGTGMLANPALLRVVLVREVAVKQLRLTSLMGVPIGGYLLLVSLVGHAR